uniref:AAA+ ATPase domain-containing protein n=1 Tax=Oryza punctata TaxID=4537 RepID=A0A0E0KUY5_ORYPU
MAGTVVSMAMPLVTSAISKSAIATSQEMSRLIGVRNDIWYYIRDELKTMEAFLRAAEVTKEKDERVKVWAEQIRDLAYDIEDCLQEFVVHVKHQSLMQHLMKLQHRRRIVVQIKSLKLRVEQVSNRNMRYNSIIPISSSSIDDSLSNMASTRYSDAHYAVEANLVGFAGPKNEIMNMIINCGKEEAQPIWIVGAGGVGKTTLAKKVYENISSKFPYHAWITVSQSFDVNDVLKDMIKQFLRIEMDKVVVSEHILRDKLKEGLEDKRYFLVLDDLWSIQAWDCIKPTSWGNNMQGSQVVVTTRNRDLVGDKSCSLVYDLKTLENKDARELLLRMAKRSLDAIEKDQMKVTFEKILKKCGGLPLAIVTIGRLLAAKDVKEWKILYAQLPSELESNPSLEAMRKVLALSYSYLPSHLKPCFLYLSIFPEDFEIKRKRLVHRWITEGFVRAMDGVNIVDVAIKYFDELINRCMIQPSKMNIEGIVKSCRVHDIMRDVIISVSRKENFVYLVGCHGTNAIEEKIRHVAYHDRKLPKIDIIWCHVRSLTLFGRRPKDPHWSLCSLQPRMLRVLDLQDVNATQKDIESIGLLRHLKYVSTSYKNYSGIYTLPRSIGKLQGLQTLDMRTSFMTTLPSEITKLQSLRILCCRRNDVMFDVLKHGLVPMPLGCMHGFSWSRVMQSLADSNERSDFASDLYVGWSTMWSNTYGVRVPRGMNNLKELEVLELVDIKRTSTKAIEELGEIRQLRKLGVTTQGATVPKLMILCEAINKLSTLHSLQVDSRGASLLTTGTLVWLGLISSPPPFLRSLSLTGRIEKMPEWIKELKCLVKINLRHSQLKEENSLEVLGALPKLMLLKIWIDAYVGEKLLFKAGAFLNLKKLDIGSLEQVKEIRFEQGTSPQMEMIRTYNCNFESGIIGIKHLQKLKEISLGPFSNVARLDLLQEQMDSHPNHPVLRVEGNDAMTG